MKFSECCRNCYEFTIFLKNVNKQLKSADFLTEISKFQKNHLNEVFAFFNLSFKHTLIFVVQPPNSQKFNVNLLPILLIRLGIL